MCVKKIVPKLIPHRWCYILVILVVICYYPVATEEECQTPNMEKGLCVDSKKCGFVTNLQDKYGDKLPTAAINFINSSRCKDSDSLYVCCDTSYIEPDPTTTTTTTTTTTPRNSRQQGKQILLQTRAMVSYEINENGNNLLLGTQCGNTSEDKVAFGDATKLGEYPWMALLRYDTPKMEFLCGGSLITNRHVLTAAHCIKLLYPVVSVRLGEHDTTAEKDCEVRKRRNYCAPPVEDYGVEKVIRHPEYDAGYVLNDVAIIKLDRTVIMSGHITPICLPVTDYSKNLSDKQDFIIAGWGATENGPSAPVLMQATVSNRERAVCQEVFTNFLVTENHLCAGGTSGIDTCRGDSGGPLFFKKRYNQKSVRFVQYGIVSHGGALCGVPQAYPGLYANVIYHLPWITNNIV